MKRGKTSKKKIATPKKKVSKSKKVSKKLNNKQLVSLSIALFLVFAIALAFTNVPQNTSITGQSPLENGVDRAGDAVGGLPGWEGSNIQTFFKDWDAGTVDETVIKYVFWIAIFFILFGALRFANFPPSKVKSDGSKKGNFLQFVLALTISFVGLAFLTPNEVLALATGYKAAMVAVVAILPFIALLFITATLVSNETLSQMSIGKIMAQLALWLFYVLFMIYFLFVGLGSDKVDFGINLITLLILVPMTLGFLLLVFNKPFRRWIWRVGNDIRIAKVQATKIAVRGRQQVDRALADTG